MIGILQVIDKSGIYQLSDKSAKIDVVLSNQVGNQKLFIFKPCIIKVKDFTAIEETMTLGSVHKWTYFYLVINDYDKLCDLESDTAHQGGIM